jgi:hypothetical protein
MVKVNKIVKVKTDKKTILVEQAWSKLREIANSLGISICPRRIPRKFEKYFWDFEFEIVLGERFGEDEEHPLPSLELGLYVSATSETRRIYELIGQLKTLPHNDKARRFHPLFFSPYIGERTAELCRQNRIAYFDMVGNCWIKSGFIFISKSVAIKPPAQRREIRKLFSPKSIRVIRALLTHPVKQWKQLELSKEVKISLGLVNRIVQRLLADTYVTITKNCISLKDGKGLLAEWVKGASLQDKPMVEYYTPEPLQQFEEHLDELSRTKGIQYALTLFAGAKYRAPFTRINRLHAYISGDINSIAHDLGLKTVPSGGNVLFIPNPDEGIFYGLSRIQDRNIVSDVQLYIDLKTAHGRAEEQAEALAERCLQQIMNDRNVKQDIK